jgi:hypothetical protein
VTLIGLKALSVINLLNLFTVVLIPVTFMTIYFIWQFFYNENIGDEMSDRSIKEKYFNLIRPADRDAIENLSRLREEIQKITARTGLNPMKTGLINDLGAFDLNLLIERFANNAIKIKFIDDFLMRNKQQARQKSRLEKLNAARQKFITLNENIENTFEDIQAQAILLVADDASLTADSKANIDEIRSKIERLDATNNEINQFYTDIDQKRSTENE